jgi:uncharacterized NAD-dependent epimerase/dehydratase family protein
MLTRAPFPIRGRKALLLANRMFSPVWAKTAVCYLMYRSQDAVAVLDCDQAGKTCAEVLGFGGGVPIVGTVDEGLALGAEIAIVGTAPMGGGFEGQVRQEVLACLRAGVDVVSGLHVFLNEDLECRVAKAATGARVWDVRKVEGTFPVSKGDGCTTGAKSVLVVGSDCNVGKMTVSVELYGAAVEAGVNASWAATGQTGMVLRERGICIDRVISDFVGGATQELMNAEAEGKDLVFVEGQGAIIHPGYAAVALGMLFGSMPDCMVLAHVAGRDKLKRLETPILPLAELIELHQRLIAPFKPCPVVGVTLNTHGLGEAEARAELERAEKETGIPATDVVRFGSSPVLEAVVDHAARR